MSDETTPPKRPTDVAGIIAWAMREQGITLNALANLLEIRPAVIEAILEEEIPVPLMLVPKIADALEFDAAPLMTQALGEQWLSILEATSVSEDPALARRLLRAVRGNREDGTEDEDDDAGPVH